MLRKVILSGVAALGLAIPVTSSASANAHEIIIDLHSHRHHHHHDFCCEYVVLYRDCCNSPWRYYGSFESEFRARHVAHELRERGFETLVRAD